MSERAPAIAAFLEGVRSGEWQAMESHYCPGVFFTGTVPQWYFTVQGSQGVISKMGDWFPFQADVSDVHVMTAQDGAVIEFERRWLRPAADGDGELEAVGVRQAHVFLLDDDGRIREQHGHCAGIWSAATFAEAKRTLAAG